MPVCVAAQPSSIPLLLLSDGNPLRWACHLERPFAFFLVYFFVKKYTKETRGCRRRKLHIPRAGLSSSPALNRFALHLAAKTIPGRRESSARQSCGCGKTSLPESAPGGGRSVFSSRTKTHFVGLFVRFWIGQRAGAFDGPPKPLLAQGRLWWWECFRATDSGHLWQWRFATAGGR